MRKIDLSKYPTRWEKNHTTPLEDYKLRGDYAEDTNKESDKYNPYNDETLVSWQVLSKEDKEILRPQVEDIIRNLSPTWLKPPQREVAKRFGIYICGDTLSCYIAKKIGIEIQNKRYGGFRRCK